MINKKYLILKALRRAYAITLNRNVGRKNIKTVFPQAVMDPDTVSEYIRKLLISGQPCMIGRFGSTELTCILNYLGVQHGPYNLWQYISGKGLDWWWNPSIMEQMQNWSGFFPPTKEYLSDFSEMMLNDMKYIDVLGSWIPDEKKIANWLPNCYVTHLRFLEPFWSKNPWTSCLKGKRVLVVHPFAKDIMYQYGNNREKLFQNSKTLPKFDLRVISAVQSLGGDCKYKNWFEALTRMKEEIDRIEYDICLLGCGAYGFPLAAHVKQRGKQAIHLGGALQLLFGIIGNRWENPNYGVKEWGIPVGSYSNLINEHWVRPNAADRPKNAAQVENACYW